MTTIIAAREHASRVIKGMRKNSEIRGVTGFLLGSVIASLWPWFAGGIGAVVLALAIGRHVRSLRRAARLTAWEQALTRPSQWAQRRVRAANQSLLVVDEAIELRSHPTLDSRGDLADVGWPAASVTIGATQRAFDAHSVLRLAGGLRAFDPPNGKKFVVVDHSLAGTEDDLAVTVEETDYFTLMSVKTFIREHPAVRAEYGSLDPTRNRVPHSLCLHFVIRFADGTFLCLRNDVRKADGGATWSVSAEEQLSPGDLESKEPADSLFRRAICEEVFGFRNPQIPLDERWERVVPYVNHYRIWSLFFEEPLCNFSLMGVAQLDVSAPAFVSEYERMANLGWAKDPEGTFYLATQRDLEDLLFTDRMRVRELFGDSASEVFADELHWTSRYRVFRVLRTLARGPLEPR